MRLASLGLGRAAHDERDAFAKAVSDFQETVGRVGSAHDAAGQGLADGGYAAGLAARIHVPEGVVVDGGIVADGAAALAGSREFKGRFWS